MNRPQGSNAEEKSRGNPAPPSHCSPPVTTPQPDRSPQQSHHQTTLHASTGVSAGGAARSPTPAPPAVRGVISFDNTKAGLQQVDKERTEALIKELSEGSPFYLNEQRKAAARERKVQEMLHKAKLFDQNVVQPHLLLAAAPARGDSSVDAARGQMEKGAAVPTSTSTKYAELASTVARMEQELLAHGDEYGLRQEKVFVTMDLDAFYAACEEKKDPSLKCKPLAVGSNTMLSTTNYVARQYGVRSAMPGFIGKRLCPSLIIVPCDYAFYKKEAEAVRDIVRLYDPDFTSGGWDELTMELSDYLRRRQEANRDADNSDSNSDGEDDANAPGDGAQHGEEEEQQQHLESREHAARMKRKYAAAERVVAEIRARITEVTQLTASAGIAPTATLAKIASNFNKPNGQHTLRLYTRGDIMRFMHGLPCRKVPGIGKSQEHILGGLGIKTVGDIYANRILLFHLITPKTFLFLLSTALGVGGMFHDDREDTGEGGGQHGEDTVEHQEWRKSIGQERTFYNLKSAVELETIARQNLLDALNSMKKKGLLARQMVLKLKHVNFRVKQYSRSIDPPTDAEEVLQRTLNALMTPIAHCFADYRLLGVRLTSLIPAGQYEQEQRARHQCQQHQQQPTLVDIFERKRDEGPKRGKRARASSASSVNSCFSISDDSSVSDGPGAESDDVVLVEGFPDSKQQHAPTLPNTQETGNRWRPAAAKDDASAGNAAMQLLIPPRTLSPHGKDEGSSKRGGGPEEDIVIVD